MAIRGLNPVPFAVATVAVVAQWRRLGLEYESSMRGHVPGSVESLGPAQVEVAVLIVAIIIIALLGGFLGGLLEFAFWAILLMAVAGALLGYFLSKAVTGRQS